MKKMIKATGLNKKQVSEDLATYILEKAKSNKKYDEIIIYSNKRGWNLGSIPKLLCNYKDFAYLQNDYTSYNINIGILALAPYNSSIIANVCPPSTDGCRRSCLGISFSDSRNIPRIKRTILFKLFPEYFYNKLFVEIYNHIIKSINENKLPVIRLNGLSDILWEANKYKFKLNPEVIRHIQQKHECIDYSSLLSNINNEFVKKSVIDKLGKCILNNPSEIVDSALLTKNEKNSFFEYFPNILFYDYTKYSKKRIVNVDKKISNYYLTFSRHEKVTSENASNLLQSSININVITKNDVIANKLKSQGIHLHNTSYAVCEGNDYDCRILDLAKYSQGSIIVQKSTDSGIQNTSGFIIDHNTPIWK